MTAEPARHGGPEEARPRNAGPAGEPGEAGLIEVSFSPAEPQLTPGAARAVLAMLLRARQTAWTSDLAEGGRT